MCISTIFGINTKLFYTFDMPNQGLVEVNFVNQFI